MPPQTDPNKTISTVTPPTNNIDPKTGIPYGAKGTKDFYVDATGNFFRGPSPIVTSGPVRKEFTDLSNDLSGIQFKNQTNTQTKDKLPTYGSFSDEYTKALDALGAKSTASTKALISSIQAQRAMRANEINSLSDNYARGLQLLGIQKNEAQSTPELLLGRIKSAENERLQKIQNLDIEENKAILDAEEAQSKNQVGLLKEKLDYIKQLRKDKQDELKAIADESRAHLDTVNKEVSLMENYASQIISQISGLKGEAKSAAIQAIADKFGVSPESVILAASGYSQKKADKASSSSLSGGYTAQEQRKLRAAGIDPTDIESADHYLYGNTEPVQSFEPNNRQTRKLAEVGISSTTISTLQKFLGQGYTLDEIIADTPGLNATQIKLLKKYVEDL